MKLRCDVLSVLDCRTQPGEGTPPFSSREPWPRTWRCGFLSQALSCKPLQSVLKVLAWLFSWFLLFRGTMHVYITTFTLYKQLEVTDVLHTQMMAIAVFHHQFGRLPATPQSSPGRAPCTEEQRKRRPEESTDEDECCCLDCVELGINRQQWRYGSCLLKMLSLAAQGRTFAMTAIPSALIELQGVHEEDTLPANGKKVRRRFYQFVDGCLEHLIIYCLAPVHNRIQKIWLAVCL